MRSYVSLLASLAVSTPVAKYDTIYHLIFHISSGSVFSWFVYTPHKDRT